MSNPQVEVTRVHPRRRPVLNTTLPSLVADSASGTSNMCLKKGETFHTPTSPPSNNHDPVLNIRSLPRRCPTSLEAITDSEERMAFILDRLTLDSPEDQRQDSPPTQNDLPAPRSVEQAHPGAESPSSSTSSLDDDDMSSTGGEKIHEDHGHESDSGLGTSVSSGEDISGQTRGEYI